MEKNCFSAVAKGQSDIYIYNPIGNSQKQITNDIYDDYNPKFVNTMLHKLFLVLTVLTIL